MEDISKHRKFHYSRLVSQYVPNGAKRQKNAKATINAMQHTVLADRLTDTAMQQVRVHDMHCDTPLSPTVARMVNSSKV